MARKGNTEMVARTNWEMAQELAASAGFSSGILECSLATRIEKALDAAFGAGQSHGMRRVVEFIEEIQKRGHKR